MKIAYITNHRLPTEKAHGHQIARMCAEFNSLGIPVELVLPWRVNQIKADLFSYYHLPKGFAIRYLDNPDFFIFKFLGRMAFYLNTIFYLIYLCFYRPDKNSFIYTRNAEIAWFFKLRGYHVAIESHEWFSNKNWLIKMLRKVDLIVVTNNFFKKEFIQRGIDEKKILIAPNGVDLEKFGIKIDQNEARQKLDLAQRLGINLAAKKILLYTGSFRTKGIGKGIREIMEAMEILNDSTVIFLAVGGNLADISFYRDLATSLDLASQVFFLPPVSQVELGVFQQVADILLMPFPRHPLYDKFMAPLKMFEYLAAGRPIISSDLSSLREILNNENCFFCRPDDANDLAEKIKLLLQDKEMARLVSERARSDARKYSWHNRAVSIIKKLESLGFKN